MLTLHFSFPPSRYLGDASKWTPNGSHVSRQSTVSVLDCHLIQTIMWERKMLAFFLSHSISRSSDRALNNTSTRVVTQQNDIRRRHVQSVHSLPRQVLSYTLTLAVWSVYLKNYFSAVKTINRERYLEQSEPLQLLALTSDR